MPVNKRSSNQQGGEVHSLHPPHRQRRKQSRRSGVDQSARMVALQEEEEEQHQQQQLPNEEHQEQQANQEDQSPHDDQNSVQQIPDEDSDGSGTDPEEFDEVIDVIRSAIRNNAFNERHFFAQLFDARKDVECPICLGIIKKTRTVMGCLHRFCQECIDKSMRLGNNECPACRIHCSSRRSLRDDLDFDALIHALYPDMVTYEEQELILHEEEKTRNEQIQASIAQISRRQSEALNKRRRTERDADDLRVPRFGRNTSSRRRNNQRTDMETDNISERENDLDGNSDPSPSDRSRIQGKNRRPRRTGTQPPSGSPAANPDGEYSESPIDPSREELLNPLGAAHNPEMLTWGRGGARSHTRHGAGSGARNTKGPTSATKENRIARFIAHLQSVADFDDKLEVHFTIVSLDKERIPNLEMPYLCCKANFSVNQLRKYVADEAKSEAEDIEMLLVKEENTYGKPAIDLSHMIDSWNPLSHMVDWSRIKLEILEGQETLARIRASCYTRELILAYQYKKEHRIQISPV